MTANRSMLQFEIESAVETAVDQARAEFERLGVLATEDAVAMAALDSPTVKALMANEAATKLVALEFIQQIIADIPVQQPNESDCAYHARIVDAVRAELRLRGAALRRLRRRAPRKPSR
jgi:hypothetical protein